MATKTSAKKTGGILGGIALFVVGIFILWNNEGRTVKEQNAINEALKGYTDVSSEKIDSKYEGKIIATTGKIDLSNSAEVSDPKFGISEKAVKLKRIVEMYQWTESCETDDNDKETCSYSKEWDDSIVDSSEFKKAGHENPSSMKLEGNEYIASNIKVGAFDLPERLVNSLSYNKDYNNEKLTEQYKNTVEGYVINEKYITNSLDVNDPQVGDLRISYKYASDGEVSILGVQSDTTIKAYTAKKGHNVYEIRRGSYTGREILENKASVNRTMKWILRILGTLAIILGIGSLFAPLQNLTNKVPVLGSIVNFSTGLFSGVVGLAISLIVIAIAWFRFRPVLSIILVVVVVGLIVFLKMKGVKLPNKTPEENKE
ncbi:MAG: TMEM43 family protein [Bacilli bacterium]|nr:TMEM43 family protein [Bacilli bacterium]